MEKVAEENVNGAEDARQREGPPAADAVGILDGGQDLFLELFGAVNVAIFIG